jgi:hypothetical protein
MEFTKIFGHLKSIKTKPFLFLVILELMVFLFSIESLIELVNIYPKLFFVFFIAASSLVFILLNYLNQKENPKSIRKALFSIVVFKRVFATLFLFMFFFIIYLIFLPDYKVIAITNFEQGRFVKADSLFKRPQYINELSEEIRTLIGDKYRVKIDDNVKPGNENSRLIIVPGIFDHEIAVETIMKLEERAEFFLYSKDESQIPLLYDLWKKDVKKLIRNRTELIDSVRLSMKKNVSFTDRVVSDKDEKKGVSDSEDVRLVKISDENYLFLEMNDKSFLDWSLTILTTEFWKKSWNKLWNKLKYKINL